MPFWLQHVAHGYYTKTNEAYQLSLTNWHDDSVIICTSHPYVFMAATDVKVKAENHPFNMTITDPYYFSCVINQNVSQLNLSGIRLLSYCFDRVHSIVLYCKLPIAGLAFLLCSQ